MPDVRYWKDEGAREALMAKGRQVFEQIKGQLDGQAGVIAIEPESGTYFCAPTLGKANDVAYRQYPDRWFYFCRLDDPSADILLPTW